MSKLIFFCKSYLGDINSFERFWASLQKHNVENIPFFACVTEKDLDIFKEKIKSFFDRSGPDFNFGPTPYIWSKNVWKDLYEKTLKPSGKSFWDAIIEIPSEIMWYGEAILEHKSIPLIPIDPLMKAYLYPWQLKGSYKLPKKKLAKIYIGVVYQSNWEFELNYIEKKKFFSRILRSLKRFLKRI